MRNVEEQLAIPKFRMASCSRRSGHSKSQNGELFQKKWAFLNSEWRVVPEEVGIPDSEWRVVPEEVGIPDSEWRVVPEEMGIPDSEWRVVPEEMPIPDSEWRLLRQVKGKFLAVRKSVQLKIS